MSAMFKAYRPVELIKWLPRITSITELDSFSGWLNHFIYINSSKQLVKSKGKTQEKFFNYQAVKYQDVTSITHIILGDSSACLSNFGML